MRILRMATAVVIGLLATMAMVTPAQATAGSTITLSPNHGGPTTPFTVTYRVSAVVNGLLFCSNLPLHFLWNGLQLTPTSLDLDKATAECVATAHTAPLSFGAPQPPGRYEVSISNDMAAVAIFTIDAVPTPRSSAPRSSPPSSRPKPATGRSTTAAPPTTPTLAPAANAGTGSPTETAPADTPAGAVLPPMASSGSGRTTTWVLVGASVIAVGLVAAGLVVLWLRRSNRVASANPARAGTEST